jgi:hypothetical protein
MNKKSQRGVKPPRNYVGYFTLCQAIGGQLEDAGKRIAVAGIHAPVMHEHIIGDLQSMKGFCDRAIEAVNAAQKQWDSKGLTP